MEETSNWLEDNFTFVIVTSEKGLQGILCMNELSFLVTCMVLMMCLTMVCMIYLSMFWMYNPSTFDLVIYVVCTNCSSLVWKTIHQCPSSWCHRICGYNDRDWYTWSEWPWSEIVPEISEWLKWPWAGIILVTPITIQPSKTFIYNLDYEKPLCLSWCAVTILVKYQGAIEL